MITGYVHSVQLSVFVKSIGFGFIVGFLYLLFMLMNSVFSKKLWSVLIRDVIFFSLSAVITYLFVLKYNSGIFRMYILCGELMGFILFYLFTGRVVMKYFYKISRAIRKRLQKIINKVKHISSVVSGRIHIRINSMKEDGMKKKSLRKHIILKTKKLPFTDQRAVGGTPGNFVQNDSLFEKNL